MKNQIYLIYIFLVLAFVSCKTPRTDLMVDKTTASIQQQSNYANSEEWQWETLNTIGKPTARHEAGLVAYKNKLILLGGRRVNPTSVYDIQTNTWTEHAAPPIEIHHFQPVVVGDAIYILGAMTGGWPTERPLDKVLIYYPEEDRYEYSHPIPISRRRGGAGAVYQDGKIYLVGGITHGHMNGFRSWFDSYDPLTGDWEVLPDAPHNRDHFQAVVSNQKLYVFAGRTSSRKTGQDMTLTMEHGNIYNFRSKEWEPVTNDLAIPTQRAGNAVFAWKDQIIVGGGESMAQVKAHEQIEAFNTKDRLWSAWPSLNRGRHGSGFAIVGDYVYIASGCGNRGGNPELTSLERLRLPAENTSGIVTKERDDTKVYQQWHSIILPFDGPETSETSTDNPFLNYKLQVTFSNGENTQIVRGYYAADGRAANTSASTGNQWHVKFTPSHVGTWTYSAVLYKGEGIAIADDISNSELFPLEHSQGTFIVATSDKEAPDFRGRGRLVASDGYFKFQDTENYWMKAGTNSPENLLGYVDFDDTYRIKAEAREGEAAAPKEIHSYAPHLKDWKLGNPTWKNGKGKALIGAMNYLASKGMNTDYFLSLNILGDGKDVWPFVSPDEMTRFDVSKLAQWDVLFDHMQSEGILLHVVLQETENETMLDKGDTGPMRKLYLSELIARFGHHLGLVWNLGEENGPAPWAPNGQNDAQRKAMASFIKKTDPYNHPVLLHTHSEEHLRDPILESVLGFADIDGLSLQTHEREHAGEVVQTWKEKSRAAGHEWLITMDEIGKWHTGALMDSEDPEHPTLRGYVLWGTLLSGGAGLEWYFGAKHPQNDLTSENWRMRDRLWELTNHARTFFENYLPYWDMHPAHELISGKDSYCLRRPNELYAIYLPKSTSYTFNLSEAVGEFSVQWYDPLQGGDLQDGTILKVQGGSSADIGQAPNNRMQDWVVLIKKVTSK